MINGFFVAIAHTKSALIQYDVELCSLTPRDCLNLEDKEKFQNLCADGCINYNNKWSCPPYSPPFHEYTSAWEKLLVIYMRINTEQFSYIRNDYLKIKAANSILKSRVDKFLCKMVEQNGRYISTGSCRLCNPCKCKYSMPCAHPDKMTYSFEALGIDVSRLVDMCFQQPLLWYKNQNLPKYTSVVCGLLTNDSYFINTFKESYLSIIQK